MMACEQCEVNYDLIEELKANIQEKNEALMQCTKAMNKADKFIKQLAQEINAISGQNTQFRKTISQMAQARRTM
jgi:capsule polysaccharide export protein KpsE/RkpR